MYICNYYTDEQKISINAGSQALMLKVGWKIPSLMSMFIHQNTVRGDKNGHKRNGKSIRHLL